MYATTHFCPDPWRGVKRSNIFIFQLQSQFHRFVYQTLYVFDQLKDIKNTRRDFYLVAMVMPQGWDLGELWINSVCLLLNHWTKSKRIWCANYSHELGVHKHIFLASWGPAEASKGQISLNQLQSQFQRFYY